MHRYIPVLFAVLSACAGEDHSALEGFYSIDAWNMNQTSCVDPGPSQIGIQSETVFYIERGMDGPVTYLDGVGCDTLAECERLANEPVGQVGTDFEFGHWNRGNDTDGWTSQVVYTGLDDTMDPPMCVGLVLDGYLAVDGERAVLLREEGWLVPPFAPRIPVDCDRHTDNCCEEDALAAVAGTPCQGHYVIHGNKIADL